eukprot:c17282_g2_i2 orf=249-1739(+)
MWELVFTYIGRFLWWHGLNMGRAPCCQKVGLKRGPWTPEEDQILVNYVNEHGHGSWKALPKKAGLLRCGKSCRLRWTNYLRPDIKRGQFSAAEEQTIIQWSAIASHIPKRTDNEIKNYWNTHLKKRLLKMGIDPITHKPQVDANNVSDSKSKISSALSHMAQWESARLEAEARLSRESTLRSKGLWPVSDVPSSTCKPDTVYAEIASHTRSDISVELMNWEMSLQGQAGFLWPGLSPTSTFGATCNISASSSCNSPHGEQSDLQSPTSTFCSLETNPENVFQAGTNSNIRKLFWDDRLLSKDSIPALEPLLNGESALEGTNLRSDNCDYLEVALNRCENVPAEIDISLSSLQDLLFADEDCKSNAYPLLPLWSEFSPRENPSTDTHKSGSDQNVSPLASMDGARKQLLSGEIESTSRSMSVNSCWSSMQSSSELLAELADSSGFNPEPTSPCGVQHGSSTSSSEMKIEEIYDYWINMLRQLVECPTQSINGGITPI